MVKPPVPAEGCGGCGGSAVATCLPASATSVQVDRQCGLRLVTASGWRELGHSRSRLPWAVGSPSLRRLVLGQRLRVAGAEGPVGSSELRMSCGQSCCAPRTPVSGSLSRGP